MLQEVSEGSKSTPKRDLLLALLLLLLIFAARGIAHLLRLLPYGGALQIVVFVGAIAGFYLFYKKRLCAYRYTLVYAQAEALEQDAYGDPVQPPYPPGAIAFERLTADKGRVVELVLPSELVAYDPSGSTPSFHPAGERVHTQVLTAKAKRSAHTLWFRREGKLHRIRFSPSPEFSAKLLAML